MLFLLTLSTPLGEAQLEVPTLIGENVARHRAIFTACAAGWGDLDEITVTECVLIGEGL